MTDRKFLAVVFVLLMAVAVFQAQDQQPKPAAGAKAKSGKTTASDPSLSDTLAWLKQTLDAEGHAAKSVNVIAGGHGNFVYQTKLSRYDGCAIVLSTDVGVVSFYADGTLMGSPGGLSSTANVSLGVLDPSAIELGVDKSGSDQNATWTPDIFWIKIVATNRKESISVSTTSPGRSPSQAQVSEFTFYISGEGIRSRIVKALGHAVSLCGGKESVF